MNPDDMQELARAMEQLPGSKGVDFKDVRRLVQLMRESPDIGSIEIKGLFGTGAVITRTAPWGHGCSAPMPVAHAVAAAPSRRPGAGRRRRRGPGRGAEGDQSPMVGTFYAQPEPGAEPYVRVGIAGQRRGRRSASSRR